MGPDRLSECPKAGANNTMEDYEGKNNVTFETKNQGSSTVLALNENKNHIEIGAVRATLTIINTRAYRKNFYFQIFSKHIMQNFQLHDLHTPTHHSRTRVILLHPQLLLECVSLRPLTSWFLSFHAFMSPDMFLNHKWSCLEPPSTNSMLYGCPTHGIDFLKQKLLLTAPSSEGKGEKRKRKEEKIIEDEKITRRGEGKAGAEGRNGMECCLVNSDEL